ncbi:hypothetical protein EDB80DRAFT_759906 [Ilyonectria destructans]|nr:hypothetical protein EDB80DRAFT_759906 [Ilyonectria destructans]
MEASGFMCPAVLQLSRTRLAVSGISSNLLAFSLPFHPYLIFLTLLVSTSPRLTFYASSIKRSVLTLASKVTVIRVGSALASTPDDPASQRLPSYLHRRSSVEHPTSPRNRLQSPSLCCAVPYRPPTISDFTLHGSSRRAPDPFTMTFETTSESRTHSDYTVGWVCALPKERIAATAMLDQRHLESLHNPPNDHNSYTRGSINNHNVVIVCLPKGQIGTNQAATVVARMVITFPSIKFGLMVGIGGGIPPHVRLGDIVVSSPTNEHPGVIQWDFGKAEEGGSFKRIGALSPPPSALLIALTTLETDHGMKESKIPGYLKDLAKNWPKLASDYTKSDSLKDILFKPDNPHRSQRSWHFAITTVWKSIIAFFVFFLGWWAVNSTEGVTKQVTSPKISTAFGGGQESDVGTDGDDEEMDCRFCDMTKVIRRKPRDMIVHYSLLASGNQVIKDAAFRDKLNKDLGGQVLCVEMEAAGLMNNFPCIIIRGICDYADSHKNYSWQEYAAALAAAFAKELLEYVQPGDVDRERTAKDIINEVQKVKQALGKVNEHLQNGFAETHSGLQSLLTEKDCQVLEWLTPINYGPQQSDYLRKRQPGTGQWLLDSAEFTTWVETAQQTLFCPGIPGAGKTILTSLVIDELTTRFGEESVGIAYVYCNFRRQHEQKAEDLLASLLKQLSQGQPLPESVKSLYDSHKDKHTRPSFDEISRAINSVATLYSRVFIVVDALDECQTSQGCRIRFLTEISSLQLKCRANIFSTSRFLPDITDQFKGSISLEIRASEQDVRRYVDGYMPHLPLCIRDHPELCKEVKTEITKACAGMFLLAWLHLESLAGKVSLKDVRTALKKLPTGGLEAYEHAYKGAMERIESQSVDQKQLAKRVLLWITGAKRPLTTLELQHALAVEVGEPELDKENLTHIEDMVSVCAGLVTVDKESDIIRLVHYTTQKYFEETQSHWFPAAETEIITSCIAYLSFVAFESGICQSYEEFEQRLQSNPLYNYAAKNWGRHAHQTATLPRNIMEFLECEAKVEASCQALMEAEWYSWDSWYSQRGMTGLHLAAYFGHVQVANDLLMKEYGPDSTDDDNRTPLSYAAENGQGAIVRLLLDNGADLESKDVRLGHSALSWAAFKGDEVVVKILLEGGWTPLLLVAAKGHKAVVRILLEGGADLESRDHRGRTPLLWAAAEEHKAVVKILLEGGADLESRDYGGQTPLSQAAAKGHEAVVKILLEGGADLESRDRRGRTPLLWAAAEEHEATATKRLLVNGADLKSKNKNKDYERILIAAKKGYELLALRS